MYSQIMHDRHTRPPSYLQQCISFWRIRLLLAPELSDQPVARPINILPFIIKHGSQIIDGEGFWVSQFLLRVSLDVHHGDDRNYLPRDARLWDTVKGIRRKHFFGILQNELCCSFFQKKTVLDNRVKSIVSTALSNVITRCFTYLPSFGFDLEVFHAIYIGRINEIF